MSDLPNGWICTTLGQVISIRNGFAFKSQHFCKEGVPVVKQSNLTGSLVDLTDCVCVPLAVATQASQFAIKRGDILVGMSGSIGEPSIYDYDFDAVQNQRTGLVRFYLHDDGHRSFIKQALTLFEQDYTARGKGLGVQNVSANDIEKTEVPLPPLSEQARIVAKIESLSAKSKRARDQIDCVPRLVEKYKQAIVAAVFQSYSTEKTATKLGDCSEFVTSGSRGWAKFYSENGARFIRVGNVQRVNIKLDWSDTQRVAPPDGSEGQRTSVKPNDLVVTITADLGRVGLIPSDIGAAYWSAPFH